MTSQLPSVRCKLLFGPTEIIERHRRAHFTKKFAPLIVAMSGEIIKADKDFTKEVDAAIPEAEKQAQNGQTQAAVEKLLALEKQTRQHSDLASTSRVIVAIVTICKNNGDWSLLNEQVQVLSKKHGQLKQAITKMVQVVMGFLDDAPSLDVKLSVIETLRTVTEGKVRISAGHEYGSQLTM